MISEKELDDFYEKWKSTSDDDKRTLLGFIGMLAAYFNVGDEDYIQGATYERTYYDTDAFKAKLPKSWQDKLEVNMRKTNQASYDAMLRDDCDVGVVERTVRQVVEREFNGAYLSDSNKLMILSLIEEALQRRCEEKNGFDLDINTSTVGLMLRIFLKATWRSGDYVSRYSQKYTVKFDGDAVSVMTDKEDE